MAVKTDFVFLYEQLGLHPGCSRDELRTAYRRRVAALHPDRPRAGPRDPLAGTQLQELTAAYDAAIDFHRRFGRLPGARQVSHVPAAPPLHAPRGASAVTGGGRRKKWQIALALVALGVVLWLLVMGPDGERAKAPAAGKPDTTGEVQPAPSAVPPWLALGMDKATVRAIEGEPVITTPRHWDYGPSWIDFDHDKVSDWHSSPLRPLKIERIRVASNRFESG